MSVLVVETCGPGTTLQDRGRFGWQRFGVGPAGAMDAVGLATANALVGNPDGACGIELALAGARLKVEGAARVALAGADGLLKIDGTTIAPRTSAAALDGATIEIGPARAGVFMYLAVAGGFDLAPTLGSPSLHLRARIGGIDGRPLRAGDRLTLRAATPAGVDMMANQTLAAPGGPIRVMLGPQDDYFSAEGLATFLGQPYTITPQADRMGLRLSGPKIAHGPAGYNIVSDGIATGAIQVPGAGEPLILLADRQTTGGYPKIATVISADLPRLAQSRPGTELRFAAVTRQAALAALAAQRADLAAFRASLAPAGVADLDSARLLGLGLVDGWIAAEP